jgi:hypothetical protein
MNVQNLIPGQPLGQPEHRERGVYLITYSLHRPYQYYRELIEAILISYSHWHFQPSAWLICTDYSCESIRFGLCGRIESEDSLFVTRITPDWDAFGLPPDGITWLKGLSFLKLGRTIYLSLANHFRRLASRQGGRDWTNGKPGRSSLEHR